MIDVPVVAVVDDDAPAVRPACSIRDAASTLRDPAVPALVVAADDDPVSGVVTESDVVAAVAEGAADRTVAACMSAPVVTVTPTTTVGLAADRMRTAGVAVLPVVDDGEYRGVVTRDALAPHVSRRRLDVSWDADPLRVDADGGESTDVAASVDE